MKCEKKSKLGENNNEKKGSTLEHAMIGGLARGISGIVLYPLDTIKTRLQYQKKQSHAYFYRGTFSAFRDITRHEGFLALYKGLSIRVSYQCLSGAVTFSVFELFKLTYDRDFKGKNWKEMMKIENWKTVSLLLLFSGLIRGSQSLFRVPFDVVKQRIQTEGLEVGRASKGIMGNVSRLTHGEGNLLRGFFITLFRDAPFSLLYFGTYEIARRMSTEYFLGVQKDFLNLFSGGLAAAVATSCTIPIDVVKTRVMIQGKSENVYQYEGLIHAFKQIKKQEGIRAFYKGLPPRLLYIVPSASLTFMVYERLKRLVVIDEVIDGL